MEILKRNCGVINLLSEMMVIFAKLIVIPLQRLLFPGDNIKTQKMPQPDLNVTEIWIFVMVLIWTYQGTHLQQSIVVTHLKEVLIGLHISCKASLG